MSRHSERSELRFCIERSLLDEFLFDSAGPGQPFNTTFRGNPFALACVLPFPAREVHMAIAFTLNGKSQSVDVDPQMPLLWVLRDTLDMTGTKFGCGMALCGACTVHINGEATRSCITPVSSVAGKKITTIEGLSADASHPVQ